jgi:hypothetical protein
MPDLACFNFTAWKPESFLSHLSPIPTIVQLQVFLFKALGFCADHLPLMAISATIFGCIRWDQDFEGASHACLPGLFPRHFARIAWRYTI